MTKLAKRSSCFVNGHSSAVVKTLKIVCTAEMPTALIGVATKAKWKMACSP